MERTVQWNDFELILTVKMETRHPAEGLFSSEFPAICNHCGVMAAWSHKMLKFCKKILHFFKKATHYAKTFKILFQKFSSRHRSTLLCSDVVKFVQWEICDFMRSLPDKKQFSLPLKLSLLRRLRPKIFHGELPTMYSKRSRFHRNWFTSGGVIAKSVNIVSQIAP